MQQVKRRYRHLMRMTHPDNRADHNYPYQAHEINAAYDMILSYREQEDTTSQMTASETDPPEKRREDGKRQGRRDIRWNAPQNPNAYIARPIYHMVEDADGYPIGEAVVDQGRYVWTADEDFALFLKSLLYSSRRIIEEADARSRRERSGDMRLLSEITYLLAQQYVDSDMVLSLLSSESSSDQREDIGRQIYSVDAMLEIGDRKRISLEAGQILYPARMSGHKLYVRDQKKRELGYLSFKDDRLYYGIIPLFERRVVLVKLLLDDPTVHRQNGRRYLDIRLYLKKTPEDKVRMIDSINLKIDQLLR